jgi:alpha-tubulin suppressor-like RCC1 family protein
MEDGDLYAWGYNVNGGMGDGTVANKNTITKINAFDKNVKSISCSGGNYNHCVVLTTDNRIFTWGGNNYGQCGQGNNTAIKQTPTEISVSGQTPVKAIATGAGSYGNTHVLMASGRVYACGTNNYGQLGLGNTTTTIYTLTQVGGGLGTDTDKHVIDVFPRGYYPENVFFLTEDGSLYATGQNNSGVQGRGNATQTTTPLICDDKLKWVSEIYHAPAGTSAHYHMGFMCHANKEDRIARRNGWFYITGMANYHCGFYNYPTPISSPMSPAFPLGVNGTLIQANVQGYMGSSTSSTHGWEVLDDNGDMYTWGVDTNGKISGNEGNLYVPAKRI